ncbi:MAG: hypothetical protein ACP6IY_15415, partial [Promethearchaeia archaeon]
PEKVKLADDKTEMEVIGYTAFDTLLQGCRIVDDVKIVKELSVDLIIGAQTLQNHRIKLSFDDKLGDWIDMKECQKRIDYI